MFLFKQHSRKCLAVTCITREMTRKRKQNETNWHRWWVGVPSAATGNDFGFLYLRELSSLCVMNAIATLINGGILVKNTHRSYSLIVEECAVTDLCILCCVPCPLHADADTINIHIILILAKSCVKRQFNSSNTQLNCTASVFRLLFTQGKILTKVIEQDRHYIRSTTNKDNSLCTIHINHPSK